MPAQWGGVASCIWGGLGVRVFCLIGVPGRKPGNQFFQVAKRPAVQSMAGAGLGCLGSQHVRAAVLGAFGRRRSRARAPFAPGRDPAHSSLAACSRATARETSHLLTCRFFFQSTWFHLTCLHSLDCPSRVGTKRAHGVSLGARRWAHSQLQTDGGGGLSAWRLGHCLQT